MRHSRRRAFKTLLIFFFSLTLYAGVRWILYEPYVIPSGSMIPSLLVHDHIMVEKFSFGFRFPFTQKWWGKPQHPHRGDIVVFQSVPPENIYLVKRVIGLPGERVRVDEEGRVYINGEVLKETPEPVSAFLKQDHLTFTDLGMNKSQVILSRVKISPQKEIVIMKKKDVFRWEFKEVMIPPDHIFVMGDNRDNSNDSRYWGTLPLQNLVGKVRFIWLSCESMVESMPYVCDFAHLRWHRFFFVP